MLQTSVCLPKICIRNPQPSRPQNVTTAYNVLKRWLSSNEVTRVIEGWGNISSRILTFNLTRRIKSSDLLCNSVTVAINHVLCTWILPRVDFKCPRHKNKYVKQRIYQVAFFNHPTMLYTSEHYVLSYWDLQLLFHLNNVFRMAPTPIWQCLMKRKGQDTYIQMQREDRGVGGHLGKMDHTARDEKDDVGTHREGDLPKQWRRGPCGD